MYLRLGLYVQIRLYCVLPYKATISAQHGKGFILDRCIVYLGLTMPNLQKKRSLIFERFNVKKFTLFFFFGTEYRCVCNISVGECNTILSAYTMYRIVSHSPIDFYPNMIDRLYGVSCRFKIYFSYYGAASALIHAFLEFF